MHLNVFCELRGHGIIQIQLRHLLSGNIFLSPHLTRCNGLKQLPYSVCMFVYVCVWECVSMHVCVRAHVCREVGVFVELVELSLR